MSISNKDFCDLLNSIADEQTFTMDLCPRENGAPRVECKQLTTAQLKKLIETVVDSPLTQASFNTTSSNIFKESLSAPYSFLNIIDRLLFILETRIQSLSPTMTMRDDEGNAFSVNVKQVKEKLVKALTINSALFLPITVTEGKISIVYGVPLLDAESQLNEEFYKDISPDLNDADEVRKLLGDSFINEIAKSLQTITVGESTLDLSTVNFETRLQAIESLPASLIQKVINYLEEIKSILDESLTVDGRSITIDGSIFSLR